MEERIIRMEEQLTVIGKTVQRIDDSVNGNGKEGLRIETDRNTQAIAFLKKVGIIALTTVLGIMSAIYLAGL